MVMWRHAKHTFYSVNVGAKGRSVRRGLRGALLEVFTSVRTFTCTTIFVPGVGKFI